MGWRVKPKHIELVMIPPVSVGWSLTNCRACLREHAQPRLSHGVETGISTQTLVSTVFDGCYERMETELPRRLYGYMDFPKNGLPARLSGKPIRSRDGLQSLSPIPPAHFEYKPKPFAPVGRHGLSWPASFHGGSYIVINYHLVNASGFVRSVLAPLPDEDYLSTHCRIAEILEVSGFGWRTEPSLDMAGWERSIINPSGSTDLGSIICCGLLVDI